MQYYCNGNNSSENSILKKMITNMVLDMLHHFYSDSDLLCIMKLSSSDFK